MPYDMYRIKSVTFLVRIVLHETWLCNFFRNIHGRWFMFICVYFCAQRRLLLDETLYIKMLPQRLPILGFFNIMQTRCQTPWKNVRILSNKSVSQPLEWCGEPVWIPTGWVYLTLPEIEIPQITWHFLSARLLVTQLVDCCLCIALVQQRSNISQKLHGAAQKQSECKSHLTICNDQSALRNDMLSSRVWIGPSLSKV